MNWKVRTKFPRSRQLLSKVLLKLLLAQQRFLLIAERDQRREEIERERIGLRGTEKEEMRVGIEIVI